MFKCLGVILDLDKYIFPWPACFIWGGHLKLELSCIQLNTVGSTVESLHITMNTLE